MESSIMSRISEVEIIALETKERARETKDDESYLAIAKIGDNHSKLASKIESHDSLLEAMSKDSSKQSVQIHGILNSVRTTISKQSLKI